MINRPVEICYKILCQLDNTTCRNQPLAGLKLVPTKQATKTTAGRISGNWSHLA